MTFNNRGRIKDTADLHRYKEVGNILVRLQKNIKKELLFSIFCMLFLFVIPLLPIYKIEGYATFVYYFVVVQLALSSLLYYQRFYYFYKSANQFELLGSREYLVKLYYELKYAIETYRITTYVLMPQGLVLFMILFGQRHSTAWLEKLYHFGTTLSQDPYFILWIILSTIASIVVVIVILEVMVRTSYEKYLKQIKSTLVQMEEL
ncbi:hypothetical protein SAMN05216436_10729 [bacterium A37T11]|nr:hypothetical protein SAMN05216436_10729 [bacterium A37T11]